MDQEKTFNTGSGNPRHEFECMRAGEVYFASRDVLAMKNLLNGVICLLCQARLHVEAA